MLQNLSSYTLGLVFIFFVAIIWSAASILVQYLYHDLDFAAPFLLTYIGTSLFVVLIPIHRLWERCIEAAQHREQSYERVAGSDGGECQEPLPAPHQHQHQHQQQDLHWSERDHMVAAAKIAPVWFISNFAYNASLQYTSITSSTVLVNTGSLFTFLFALIMRDEHFSYWKLLGVMFGMGGTIITGLHDATSPVDHADSGDGGPRRLLLLLLPGRYLVDDPDDHLLWGDTLSVVSAAFYGVYAVMVRVLCPRDESLMSMQLFLGYVGMWNGLALSPVVIWQLGVAKSVSISAFVFGCLVIKGLFDNVLSDYLWARSVILTSATVATVGLGLTIPLAFLSDVLMGREDIVSVESVVGALAVLTGFILVNVGQQQDVTEEREQTPQQVVLILDDTQGLPLGSAGDADQHEGIALESHAHDGQAMHHMSIEIRTPGPAGFKD